MTTQEIIEYYSKLLIIQYATKPKAVGTVQSLVGLVVMDQLPAQLRDAFNIDTAVGVQLDVLGKYAGVTRAALDFTGMVSLSDTDFRALIKLKIVKNNSGSSLYDIQKIITTFFNSKMRVFDYTDMTMLYFFDSTFASYELAQVAIRAGLFPRPMGVFSRGIFYLPNIYDMFEFRTYTTVDVAGRGFNSYASYNLNWPWLSYANKIA
jgi:hypothetical protein